MDRNIDINSLMTREQQVLSGLLAESLFNIPFVSEGDIDWEGVIKESKSQAVTAVAFQNPKSFSEMDKEVQNELSKYVTVRFMKNVKIRQNHAYLHKLMNDAGIKYCVLKGTASAHYYPQPLLRSMGDVDFYVDRNDVETTKQLLFAEGFELDRINNGERGHHMVFRKNGKHLELHFEIAGIPDSPVGDIIRDYFNDIIELSNESVEEYVTYTNPSAFHHGLVMLLHMQHHIVTEGIGLRHLCDWAVFINKFNNNEFTDLYKETLERSGLWNFARIISLVACICLKLPKQDWMSEESSDTEIAEGIAIDILSGGNFGRKIKNRKYERLIISVKGRDGKRKSKFVRSFESLNKMVNVHWPVVRKLPFLYPIGWVFFVLRLFVMIMLGKRPKLKLFRSFKESDRRSELYGSLKLFEPGK